VIQTKDKDQARITYCSTKLQMWYIPRIHLALYQFTSLLWFVEKFGYGTNNWDQKISPALSNSDRLWVPISRLPNVINHKILLGEIMIYNTGKWKEVIPRTAGYKIWVQLVAVRLIIEREMVSTFNIAQSISRQLIACTKLLLESRSRWTDDLIRMFATNRAKKWLNF
jgi:hypothetical protein